MIITNTLPQYTAKITLKPVEDMTVKHYQNKPLLKNANILLFSWVALVLFAKLLGSI